ALSSLIAWGTSTDRGIATGWTLYPPLSSKTYHNGLAVDLGKYLVYFFKQKLVSKQYLKVINN
ncbi:MAG: hypothetical protein ACTS80_01030, partial [Candidatus Hodgkinia cicadicola]